MAGRRRTTCPALGATYDTLAREYAKRIYGELKDKPFDRGVLDRFAGRVNSSGPVCDLGCGPAHVARYLRDRGLSVFGLDISSGMLAEARRLNPDLPFVQGNMSLMGIKSETLGGIAAFYSIIHIERDKVRGALSEMWRVLRRGGRLVLAFHLGIEVLRPAELWGHTVDFWATLFTTPEMLDYVKRAGFQVEESSERDPYPEDVEHQSRRGYIMALKPGG
jgi:SAM-dependent methyltransferase